jgi:hypothetical protein
MACRPVQESVHKEVIMVTFRLLGVVHLVAGVVLAVAPQFGVEATPSIAVVQLVAGVVLLAIGIKFKL